MWTMVQRRVMWIHFSPGYFNDQRTQREGEGHGETNVAQIKHGRMDHHLGILQ